MKKSVKQAETQEVSYKHSDIRTTTVFILPALSLYPDSSEQPWITASVEGQLLHPLTLKHYPYNLPARFDITKLNPSPLAIAHHIPSSSFAKLLVVPNPTPKYNNVATYYGRQYLHGCTMLALCKDGQLRERLYGLASWWPWEKLSYRGTDKKFDDIVLYNGYIYGVDSEGVLYLIINQPGKLCIDRSLDRCPDATVSRWRNRLLVEWGQLYIVIRSDEKVFHVYTSISQGKGCLDRPVKIDHFMPKHVLFMAKDYYFFCRVGLKFPGMQLENCIVFSQDAFTRDGAWGNSQTADDIAIYRLRDKMLSREGELGELPKLDWSPPPWVLDSWSGLSAESSSHSESEPEKDKGIQSVINISEPESEDHDDDRMQCDSDGREKESEEMHTYANTDGVAPFQKDASPSLFGSESESETDALAASLSVAEEVSRTLLSLNGGNYATAEGTSTKSIPLPGPKACTSSTTKSCKDNSATTTFEGFDIRPDLVAILQKIWQKHGNIIEKSTVHSGDIVARALESLATMVLILEGNSAQTLTVSQADYLRSTLSDLICIRFKVDWLVPFVKKAVKLHKKKPLLDSLNNLTQLSSQVKERIAIMSDELAKLAEEDNKLEEEIAKVSNMKVKLDEPLGLGLT